MVLFAIPDIRLFWTEDDRFTSQFREGKIVKFNSYSKHPMCYKDVSFWLPETGLHPNDVYEVSPAHTYIHTHTTQILCCHTIHRNFFRCIVLHSTSHHMKHYSIFYFVIAVASLHTFHAAPPKIDFAALDRIYNP